MTGVAHERTGNAALIPLNLARPLLEEGELVELRVAERS